MSLTEQQTGSEGTEDTHTQYEQCCGSNLRLRRMSGHNQPQDLVLIKELELILDSCKLELTPVDEVWPNLYIGNV